MKSILKKVNIYCLPEGDSGFSAIHKSNLRHTLIVLEAKDGSESEAFLAKIFEAVNIDLTNDVLLLSGTLQSKISFASLIANNQIKNVLSFGIDPKQLGIHFYLDKYQIVEHQQVHFLLADALAAIQQDRNLKSQLWSSLKNMFQV